MQVSMAAGTPFIWEKEGRKSFAAFLRRYHEKKPAGIREAYES